MAFVYGRYTHTHTQIHSYYIRIKIKNINLFKIRIMKLLLVNMMYFYEKITIFQNRKFSEKRHCFTFLQSTLMSCLIKGNWMLICPSTFNLFDVFVEVHLALHRYVVKTGKSTLR